MSRTAVDNASAEESVAESTASAAPGPGQLGSRRSADKALQRTRKDVAKARAMAQEVFAYAERVARILEDAKGLVERVATSEQEGEAAFAAKRLERLAGNAEKDAKRTEKIAESLKARWLSLIGNSAIPAHSP